MKNTASGIQESAVSAFYAEQVERFIQNNPRSVALGTEAKRSLFDGVPMHWMADWSTPTPLFVERAKGARFYDVDGHEIIDFCLGDTGSMFGHSPDPIVRALREQADRGLTVMLPSPDAIQAGNLLQERFGLAHWQVTTTATDANRFVIRWARAITKKPVILVFDGCYHGTADDTMVRYDQGKTVARAGLIGQVVDLSQHSRAIPFNDEAALEAALAQGDVAALLCEPAMTNIGMVLPKPGFMQKCRELTRHYGSLLIIDETHTISTGYGGCTQAWNLQPDFFVAGKPIAGGIPCAVYGCTETISKAMQKARLEVQTEGHGHSGMGTTLSANPMALHCMAVNLSEVMTREAYDTITRLGDLLAQGFRAVIQKHQLAWSVTRLGSRCELQFCATPPTNGVEAEAAFHDSLQRALHLYLINQGVLITPFHNMTLCCPSTTEGDVATLINALDQGLTDILAIPNSRC